MAERASEGERAGERESEQRRQYLNYIKKAVGFTRVHYSFYFPSLLQYMPRYLPSYGSACVIEQRQTRGGFRGLVGAWGGEGGIITALWCFYSEQIRQQGGLVIN